MDKETVVVASQGANRVCTNMILSLQTMWEVECEGVVNPAAVDRLKFAIDVVAVLRDQLNDEFELISLGRLDESDD